MKRTRFFYTKSEFAESLALILWKEEHDCGLNLMLTILVFDFVKETREHDELYILLQIKNCFQTQQESSKLLVHNIIAHYNP